MTSGAAHSHQGRSQVSPSTSTDEVADSDADENVPTKRFRGSRRAIRRLPRLRRLVSQDALSCQSLGSTPSPQYLSRGSNEADCNLDTSERSDDQQLAPETNEKEILLGRESPMRCVSEFDKVAAASDDESDKADDQQLDDTDVSSRDAPPLPNPLRYGKVLSAHVRALRIEAELHPLRVVLSRLMSHPTFNRKGLFNHPVDPVALRLPDYHTIVTKPMDLGTVKARLHAIAYYRQDEVVEDIRLVFNNAMLYNPPGNPVHVAAKNMLEYFEELYATIVAVKDSTKTTKSAPPVASVVGTTSNSVCPQPQAPLCSSACDKENSSASSMPFCPIQSESSSGPIAIADTSAEAAKPVGQTTYSSLCNLQSNECAAATHPPAQNCDSALVQPVHTTQTTRSRPPTIAVPQVKPIRRRRSTQVRALSHSCQACLGRLCAICNQGCLPLEPTLLICTGANCAGAKIRKGATYYIAKDGSRQFCQRCYTNLTGVMQHSPGHDSLRYKSDLLKRKNEEEVAERWLTCRKCGTGVHQICAMHNEFVHSDSDMPCPNCHSAESALNTKSATAADTSSPYSDLYTFMSGADLPVPMSSVVDRQFLYGDQILNAESLQETPVSAFIQNRVRSIMQDSGCVNAERTILVRIISDCDREFHVPDVVRKHFRMESRGNEEDRPISPPSKLNYHSQAIALFQKVDALDVCIFCMYVQEYDGDDVFDKAHDQGTAVLQKKRVYIAYLDSVEHFRPRSCRTMVYHEMLVSYLAAARARGYETAHIWACPPSRGNSFVFWNHPASQRTPTKERLEAWYHGALSRAIECGVVTDVKSLYESDFQRNLFELNSDNDDHLERNGRMICPPLFEGDFWVDEAVRIHAASIARNLKARLPGELPCGRGSSAADDEDDERCPAVQVAALLRDRLIAHPSSVPFRRPVNAAALKLHDYHRIITKPMDLGTVYSRCVMGEYRLLSDLVSDVQLVFANAKRYNPKGHIVHDRAIELETLFTEELHSLTNTWSIALTDNSQKNSIEDMSMSLDMRLEAPCVTVQEVSNSEVEQSQQLGVDLDETRQVETEQASLANVADEKQVVQPEQTSMVASPEVVEQAAADSKNEADMEIAVKAETDQVSSIDEVMAGSDEQCPSPMEVCGVENAACPSQHDTARPPTEQGVAALSNETQDQEIPARCPATPVPCPKVLSPLKDTVSPKRMFPSDKVSPKKRMSPPSVELLSGGPEAIFQRMVGGDFWLMDKKNPVPPKNVVSSKKSGVKRRRSSLDLEEQPKRRRQAWLGEEVGASVRRMRTSFFACSLVPKQGMTDEEQRRLAEYEKYVEAFSSRIKGGSTSSGRVNVSHIADARHAFHELSQYRNFEFDTLRRAKYSTAMLLYHLHNDDAPGLVPVCSSCNQEISELRWHKVRKEGERPRTYHAASPRSAAVDVDWKPEELCSTCYAKHPKGDDFIPLQVSLKSTDS